MSIVCTGNTKLFFMMSGLTKFINKKTTEAVEFFLKEGIEKQRVDLTGEHRVHCIALLQTVANLL